MIKLTYKEQPPQIQRMTDYFKTMLGNLPIPKGKNVFIAGGAFKDYIINGYVKSDIDLYFSDKTTLDLCNEHFDNSVQTECVFDNDRVSKYEAGRVKVDLVKYLFASPEQTIDSFDFTVACAAMDRYKTFYHHDTFWIDLAGRKLVINNLPFPASTLRRVQKYVKKGFTICNGGIIQLAMALQNSNEQLSLEGLYVD